MLMNAAALGLTRLHVKWVNKRYEFSRWTLFVSMLLMAVQYFVQMDFGIRAASDEVATVVNILFYMPCFAMFAVAIYNIVAVRVQLLRYVSGNAMLYALVVAICAAAYIINGNLEMGEMDICAACDVCDEHDTFYRYPVARDRQAKEGA